MKNLHRPRKRFGQHFLHDPHVIIQIINAINPQASQHMVEIGPGMGILTELLLSNLNRLDAIEIDRDLIKILCAKFPTLHLHNQDVLHFDFSTLAQPQEKLRIVGNLPYNISTPLLFHLFAYLEYVQDMHFMLQKEVVMRMCAPVGDKNYNRFSVMSQYYCSNQLLFEIQPTAFKPQPAVVSAFVRLIPQHRKNPAKNLALFSQIVKNAFMYRRKTLANSLKGIIDADTLRSIDISPSARAQNLSVEEYIKISNFLGRIAHGL